MSTRTESAARRHLERHLREQGHARAYCKRVSTLLSLGDVKRLLPLSRRLQAELGRFPRDGMADASLTASEGEQDRGRSLNLGRRAHDTAPTPSKHKDPEPNLSEHAP